MSASSAQKELKVIVKALEAKGIEVVASNGHMKLFYGGKVVQRLVNPDDDPNDPASPKRPITLPSTPSDSKWRADTVKELIRWNVLDEDPFGSGKGGLTDEDRERRSQKRETRSTKKQHREESRKRFAETQKERIEATKILRARAEKILDPIGVWRLPGLGTRSGGANKPKQDIGEANRIAFALATKRGGYELPKTNDSGYMMWRKMFLAEGGLSRTAWIEDFLTEIEQAPDPVRHYFQLLRDMLGIEEGTPKPAEVKSGVEPLAVEAEDDERIKDLRSRLTAAEAARLGAEQAKREADKLLEESADNLRAARASHQAAADAAAELKAELDAAHEAANGTAKIPELAFEVFGEMVGQLVQVAGEDGSVDYEEVLKLVEQKKSKALELAKQVAALELGIAE